MDWSFLGRLEFIAPAAGLVGVLVGAGISAWANLKLAERKFAFDKNLAERKFRFDRDLHDHKRKVELAEQALIAFYEARDVFTEVRARGCAEGEGSSCPRADGESDQQQHRRDMYFIPIARLVREKEVFARLQSLRYAFAARLGETTGKPFKEIWKVHSAVVSSANVLIQMTGDGDDDGHAFRQRMAQPLDTIGWGTVRRPDDIDRQIDKAIEDIENVCRPVLANSAAN